MLYFLHSYVILVVDITTYFFGVMEQEFNEEYKKNLFEDFFAALPRGFHSEDIRSQLWAGYSFAYDAHEGVRRKGGNHDPYITHPVAVALITANEIGLGVGAVMAALLHDVVEDTHFTSEDIEERFGKSVANIVDGVTKITKKYNAEQNIQAETFKKMLLSIPHDPRVAFVKIADRVHNMRTIDDMPDGTRQIKAGENLYVYVSIASQMGLYDIKCELEDLSFKYVHPLCYQELRYNVDSTAELRENLLSRFKLCLLRVLVKTGFTCSLSVITKSLYQTWLKMKQFARTFDEINNYQSVRIVFDPKTNDPDEVFNIYYRIYASVIGNFPEKPNSRRDYIKMPKPNGFRALVFQVMYGGNWMEVQLLTAEDDMVAHRGYSLAHAYRDGLNSLKKNLVTLDPNENAVDLLKRFRTLSNVSTIYIFTPKGDIVELPQGATVLDLAFAIHEKMGQHCVGAVLGHTVVPVNHVLQSTDQAEVLTSPSAKPNPEWHGYVKSDKAIQWLENYFRQNAETEKAEVVRGKQMFHNIMRENRKIASSSELTRLIKHYRMSSIDELYRVIARREISPKDLVDTIMRIRAVLEGEKKDRTVVDTHGTTMQRSFIDINYKLPLTIDGSIPFILSSCCCPIPGDDSLACTDDEGIVFIHRRECENARKLTATRGKQTTKVLWSDDVESAYVPVHIQGTDRPGLLRDLAVLLYECGVAVKTVNLEEIDGIFEGSITILVKNASHLESIISKMTNVQGVVKTNRISRLSGRS
ncbi:MAG: bifunctional (p)ppGpp synthetase/guanosine-3',5'-bis(diphosphate) 3'-pyrophosphohydrolase [Bacteroidales bacterium]|nr:bifunctional (p)ppGpp synthetase/guanosine-3',5'-bis(diphosphate) 3'-pyrophosphohydrolase [Bacteroidales bacterium]